MPHYGNTTVCTHTEETSLIQSTTQPLCLCCIFPPYIPISIAQTYIWILVIAQSKESIKEGLQMAALWIWGLFLLQYEWEIDEQLGRGHWCIMQLIRYPVTWFMYLSRVHVWIIQSTIGNTPSLIHSLVFYLHPLCGMSKMYWYSIVAS